MNSKKAVLKDGWTTIMVFLVIYILGSIAAGYALNLLTALDEAWLSFAWIIITGILSILLVYIFGWPKTALTLLPAKAKDKGNIYSDQFLVGAVAGFLLSAGLLGLGATVIYFTGSVQWIVNKANVAAISGAALAMTWIAFYEELVFRGFIMEKLWSSYNRWTALLASAVIFTLFHAFNPGITPVALLNIFTGGILVGLTYMYNRNLWMPVFFHFGWNFIQGSILGFKVSGLDLPSILHAELNGREWITGGGFGFEGSMIQSLAAMTGIILLLFSLKQNYTV